MKILFITAFFYPVTGGVEKHIYELAIRLIKKGHEVIVFTSDLSKGGKIQEKESVIDGIKIKRFKTLYKLGDFASFFPGMYPAVLRENADIVHIHAYRNPHNLAAYLTKNAVMTLHWPNYPLGLRKRWLDLAIRWFDRFVGPTLLNRCKKLLAVTEPEIDWIEKKFNIKRNKIQLIPNGIPLEALKLANGIAFRKKYNLKEKHVVISIGRIHKSKGFDKLINIASQFNNAKFVFVGPDGGYLNALQRLAASLNVQDKILFTEEISEQDKWNALASCDVFCHPTNYDAFGIVILEAMAQGKAVLGSNVGGVPWVISDAGVTFEKDNLHDLAKKLKSLLAEEQIRRELGRRARKRAEGFTWEKITDELEKVYKEVCNESAISLS